jgi:hypothetical protein
MTVTPFRHIAPDLDPNSGAHVMSLIRTHPDGSQTIKIEPVVEWPEFTSAGIVAPVTRTGPVAGPWCLIHRGSVVSYAVSFGLLQTTTYENLWSWLAEVSSPDVAPWRIVCV